VLATELHEVVEALVVGQAGFPLAAAELNPTMNSYEEAGLFSVDDTELVEHTVESEHLYSGAILNLRRDTVQLANGRQARREVVEHVQSVAAVPLLDDGRVMLVEQWRYPVEQALLEIPAGIIDPGEQAAAAMQRELQEEIGHAAGQLELLFSVYLAPGYSQELIHIFLAQDLQPAEAVPDADELIRVKQVSFEDAVAACLRGELTDAKTVVGLLAVAARRQLG